MASREELLKQAKRKMLLEKAKEKMAASASQEVTPDQTAMGFLGAEMPEGAPTDPMALAEGAMNTLAGYGSGLPVVGPMVDELAKTEAVSGRPGGMSDEQYAKLVEMGGGAREGGKFLGTTGGFMAAPATILAQMGLAGADMVSRGAIGGQEITPEEVGIMASATMAPAGLGKLAQKFKGINEKMRTSAGELAETAAGLDISKSARKALSEAEIVGDIEAGEFGNMLLDRGVVKPFQGPKKTASKALEVREAVGKDIDKVLAGSQGSNTQELLGKFKSLISKKSLRNETEKAVDKKAKDIVSSLAKDNRAKETTEKMAGLSEEIKMLSSLDASEEGKRVVAYKLASAKHKQNKIIEAVDKAEEAKAEQGIDPEYLQKLNTEYDMLDDVINDLEGTTSLLKDMTPESLEAQIMEGTSKLEKLSEKTDGASIPLTRLRELKDDIRGKGEVLGKKKTSDKAIHDTYKNSIKESLGEQDLERLKALNKEKEAAEAAFVGSIDSTATRASDLGKYAAMHSVAQGSMAFPAMYATKALWAKHGAALAAAGLRKGSIPPKHLGKFAEAAENRGKAGVGALHFQLMQDDPEYRKKNMKGKE